MPLLPPLGDDQTIMNKPSHFIQQIENLLGEGFAAEGSGLTAKVRSLGDELPEDLRGLLLTLDLDGKEDGDNESQQFAFLCGRAYQQLETLQRQKLESHVAFLAPDGTAPPEMDEKDFDAIARFITLRNRLLKTVADYTLKFLLVSAILLVIGLALGLI